MDKFEKFAVLALVLAGTCVVEAAPAKGIIVKTTGEKMQGLISWRLRDKAYDIRQDNLSFQVPEAEVADLQIQKPGNFDAAVQSGNVTILKKIQEDYDHLKWDVAAARELALIYLKTNPAAALAMCEAVEKKDPKSAYVGQFATVYWQVLIANNRNSKLEENLAKAAASGDRYSSAAALVARGDLILKRDNSIEGQKKALAEGYLRVYFMYDDVPEIKRQAMAKAVECFRATGHGARANAMETELRSLK
jgi:hypothetical protein